MVAALLIFKVLKYAQRAPVWGNVFPSALRHSNILNQSFLSGENFSLPGISLLLSDLIRMPPPPLIKLLSLASPVACPPRPPRVPRTSLGLHSPQFPLLQTPRFSRLWPPWPRNSVQPLVLCLLLQTLLFRFLHQQLLICLLLRWKLTAQGPEAGPSSSHSAPFP